MITGLDHVVVLTPDIADAEANAGKALAPDFHDAADALSRRRVACGRHQLERHVVEGEQHGFGAVDLAAPRRRAPEQQFIGFGAGLDIPKQHNEVVQAGDHGNSPRVFLAARTFSTPIAIAAVRCGILSALDRATIWSKARSRI